MFVRYILLAEIIALVLAAKIPTYDGPQSFYCGKHLTKALSKVCDGGGYNSLLDVNNKGNGAVFYILRFAIRNK